MISTKTRFPLLPAGIYRFTVSRVPKLKQSDGGYEYYEFDLEAEDPSGKTCEYREFCFPNEERLKDILLALGGEKDEGGEVHLDEHQALGQTFKGEIKHERIKGKERARIVRIVKDKEFGKDEEPPF